MLLIVDCIVDWARDVYRPNLLRQLQVLDKTNLTGTMSLIDEVSSASKIPLTNNQNSEYPPSGFYASLNGIPLSLLVAMLLTQ